MEVHRRKGLQFIAATAYRDVESRFLSIRTGFSKFVAHLSDLGYQIHKVGFKLDHAAKFGAE